MKSKNIILLSVIALIILGGIGYIMSRQKLPTSIQEQRPKTGAVSSQQSRNNLTPVSSFSHAHGLAVDAADPTKIYIATHEGLFLLRDEKDLYQIGKSVDDFMGFSPHPTETQIFYSSGHPRNGGNLGVQKSEDGGVTWKRISQGARGPVDFHAMAISSANPNIMYGWYGGLQKSADQGRAWVALTATLPDVISLAADPQDENSVYAATTQGLYASIDQGQTWKSLSSELVDTPVTVFARDPNNRQNALSFSEKQGLARSEDGGITWKNIAGIDDVVFHVAFDKNTSGKAYLLTKSHALYKTLDGGETWITIR